MQFQPIIKADGPRQILDVLDPIVAVAGKEGQFILNFSESSIRCVVKDEASVMMCTMEAEMSGTDYSPSIVNPLQIPADRIVDALKSMSDEEVTIGVTASGQILVHTASRRRVFNSYAGAGKGTIPREISFSPEVCVTMGKGQLSRLAGLERIGETTHMRISEGGLRIITAGDGETDEVIIPTQAVSDAQTSVGTAILTGIVKRIRADTVDVCYSDKSLMSLKFSIGCASFVVLIAPRVESE